MTDNTPERRKEIIEDIAMQHAMGNETLGTAVRRLRLEVTGLDQDTFALMCKMSTKALYQIEKDKGNPTLSTIESILRKFGLRLGLTTALQPIHAPQPEPHKPATYTLTRGAKPRRK